MKCVKWWALPCAAVVGLVFCGRASMADTVVWQIDSTASYIRLNIPDQDIPVSEEDPPVPAGMRDYSGPFLSPPAPDWTDAGGRRSFVEGTISTEYTEGSSLQFNAGSHTAAAIHFGSFRPDHTTWDGTNYAEGNTGAPAAFGASLILGPNQPGAFVVGFVAIRDVGYDFDGSVALTPSGGNWVSTNNFLAGVVAGAVAHGQTAFGNFFEPLNDTTIAENVGGVTVVNEGGNLRRLVISLNIPVQIELSGIILEASAVGTIEATAEISSAPSAQVVASFVSHSSFSGAGTPPNNRIDTGKVLAKQGSGPTPLVFANLINTAQGINGLVFDVQDLANESLGPGDFTVQVSPTGIFDTNVDYSTWQAGPAPTSVTVTPGSPARVLVQWTNGLIVNRWLRLTVKAENTGLAADEVYYLGHLLGETTGLSGTSYSVTFADITPIRSDVGQVVDASSLTDIDKSGSVTFGDISSMRPSVGTVLSNITIP